MNENINHKLELLVERTVRPLRAPFITKKRMREDLLSHLSSTFEDEFTKSDDETESLRLTRERFGDPAEVSRELQQSVPTHHVFSYWYEQLLAQQPGESFFHLTLKHLFAGFLYFCVLVVIGLTLNLNKDDRTPAAMLWIFADLMIVMSFMGTLMHWLTDQMGRAMCSSDPQARRLKWRYGLLSLLVFPGIMALSYLGLGLYFGMEAMLPRQPVYLVAFTLAFVGPIVTTLIGPISAERTLYQEKWAAVDVPAE